MKPKSKNIFLQTLLLRPWNYFVTCISATMFSSGFRWTVKASLISLTPSKRTSISTKCCVSPSLNSISKNITRHLKVNLMFITSCNFKPSYRRQQLIPTFQITQVHMSVFSLIYLMLKIIMNTQRIHWQWGTVITKRDLQNQDLV